VEEEARRVELAEAVEERVVQEEQAELSGLLLKLLY
jgi:hypothetical protein